MKEKKNKSNFGLFNFMQMCWDILKRICLFAQDFYVIA